MKMDEIEEADILVEIPSYNNSRTNIHLMRGVMAGLAKYFPKAKAV